MWVNQAIISPFLICTSHIHFSNYELFCDSRIMRNQIVKSWFGSLLISLGRPAPDNRSNEKLKWKHRAAVMLHFGALMALVLGFSEANDALCSYLSALGVMSPHYETFLIGFGGLFVCRMHVISSRPRYRCCYSNPNYKSFINSQQFLSVKGGFTLSTFTYWGN